MLDTFEEKREASQKHFAATAAQTILETTPLEITPKIEAFVATLGGDDLAWVPVVPDKYGLFGWCSDGVQEKILNDGGSIRFGWTIWELPKTLATAEFHAVWFGSDGELYDITPKPSGEHKILFVPDRNYAADFDFDEHPPNRRHRLYEELDYEREVQSYIKAMKPTQLKYEMDRAAKAGESLEKRILQKLAPDTSVAKTIDSFIEACDLYEKKLNELLPGSGYVVPDDELMQLAERRNNLNAKVLRISKKLETDTR